MNENTEKSVVVVSTVEEFQEVFGDINYPKTPEDQAMPEAEATVPFAGTFIVAREDWRDLDKNPNRGEWPPNTHNYFGPIIGKGVVARG